MTKKQKYDIKRLAYNKLIEVQGILSKEKFKKVGDKSVHDPIEKYLQPALDHIEKALKVIWREDKLEGL